jgi:hypothetical protein
MPATSTKKFALRLFIAALLAGLVVGWHFLCNPQIASREQLLQFIPADSTAVVFLDLDEFRQSPFLARMYSWAPHPNEDSEYAQFVRDTGFSYERNLTAAVVAISNHGATTNLFVVADGKFDRKKIEAFLNRTSASTQQGKLKVFLIHDASAHDKPVWLAFLSEERIAMTDAPDLAALLSSAANNAGRAEWNSRFARLAGTPLFMVVRQDPEFQKTLNSAAPGGLNSPQLAALLDQLQWISIAAKPEGDQLRTVAEGECLSEVATSQLRDMLQGILLLAQNGLNDPKLRQQMNPQEREAYLEILKGADVQKIDRGDWKTVRVALSITPKFLDLARTTSTAAPKPEVLAPTETPKHKHTPGKTQVQKKN